MKKIISILILLLLYFIIINQKLSTAFIEKIDLNLFDDELAVIFLSSDSYKTVLLKDKSSTTLLVLDLKNDKDLRKNLNKFVDNKLDYLFLKEKNMNLNVDYSIKDVLNDKVNMEKFFINRNDNIIYINNNTYNLCLYNIGKNNNVENCDFIYFLDMDIQVNMKENMKAVFYEKKIANKFKENSYIKWIDNYELSNDVYNILKLSNDSYDIITIPSEN